MTRTGTHQCDCCLRRIPIGIGNDASSGTRPLKHQGVYTANVSKGAIGGGHERSRARPGR